MTVLWVSEANCIQGTYITEYNVNYCQRYEH